MLKQIVLATAVLMTSQVWADEPRFSLELSTGGHPNLSAADEARRALWEDPMARLMRAADAEFGHLLIGQPGGRTPPVVVIGFQAGVAPHILGASIENSLSARTSAHTVTIPWPWLPKSNTNQPTFEEELALDLGDRLNGNWATADP